MKRKAHVLTLALMPLSLQAESVYKLAARYPVNQMPDSNGKGTRSTKPGSFTVLVVSK